MTALTAPVHRTGPHGPLRGHVHFERHGCPDAPTKLVLFHGVGGTGRMWRPLLHRLGDTVDAAALDLLGHGLTRVNEDAEMGPLNQAQAAIAAADRLGWRDFVVVGHSMGGAAAMAAALTVPRRVTGLILVAGAVYHQRTHALLTLTDQPWAATAAQLTGMLFHLPAVGRLALRLTGGKADPAMVVCSAERCVAEGMMTSFRDVRRTPGHWVRYYPTLDRPALIIHGQRDSVVPPWVAERLHDDLPDSRLVWVDCRHEPHLTHPDAVAAEVHAFLAELTDSQRDPEAAP